MPASPELPESDGDLGRCHDADITTDTIIPTGLADKLGEVLPGSISAMSCWFDSADAPGTYAIFSYLIP